MLTVGSTVGAKNRDASSSQFGAVERVAGSTGLSRSHEAVPDVSKTNGAERKRGGGALKTLRTSAMGPCRDKNHSRYEKKPVTLRVSLFVSSKARR